MIPKAEGSEMERKKYTDAKIKLVLSYTWEEYSELYLIKHSHVYIVNQKFPALSVQFLSINWQILQGKPQTTKCSTVHTPETIYLEEKYFFLTFSVPIYVH